MKKLINLIALVMLVSTNVLTPFSYAQEETSEVIPENEVENVEEIGETPEKDNEITGEIPNSLGEVEGEGSLPLVREVVNETSPAKQGENLEELKEEVEDSLDDVESPTTDENKDEDTEKVEIDEAAQLVEGNTEREKQEENLEDNNEITEQENPEIEAQGLQITQEINTMDTTINSKDIVIEAISTEENQTIKINKYFTNDYTVDWGEGSGAIKLTSDTTYTYITTGIHTIILSLTGTSTRWTFKQTRKPLVPIDGTTMSGIKISSMPSLADGFGNNSTNPGNNFFGTFNNNGALISLPEGSFNTSNIITAGDGFFDGFNNNGSLIRLPEGSFNISNITNAGDGFFISFNNNGLLTSLPAGSFKFSSGLTTVGDYFFYLFNYKGSLTNLPEGSFNTEKITTVGNDFFYSFNNNGSLTSLPAGSFKFSSGLTTVGDYFFYLFNYNGSLTNLPEGSFNTENITTVGDYFFYFFNYNGSLTSLPVGSFKFSSGLTTVGDYFFAGFNQIGKLTSLPEGSFNTEDITTVGYKFFHQFNDQGSLTELPEKSFNIKHITKIGDEFFRGFNYSGLLTSLPEGSFSFSLGLTEVGSGFFYLFNYKGDIKSLPTGSFNTNNINSVGNNFFLSFNAYGKIKNLPDNSFKLSTGLTYAGDGFFRQFNYHGAMERLPEGSFNTENITSAGNNVFHCFNQNGKIMKLPDGSFNISNITLVGDSFFRQFNYSGSIEILPNGSFDTSNIILVDDYFFRLFNYDGAITTLSDSFTINATGLLQNSGYTETFNSPNYTMNRKVSDLVSGVTAPMSDRNTFSDNQPGRCGVHENWLVSKADACHILYDANGGEGTTTGGYESDATIIEVGSGITLPTREGCTFSGWQDASGNNIEEVIFPDMDGQIIYAQWTPNEYSITFEDSSEENEKIVISGLYLSDTSSIKYPKWTKEGYKIVWDKEIPATMPAENMIIKASWEKNGYSGGGGGGGSSKKTDEDTHGSAEDSQKNTQDDKNTENVIQNETKGNEESSNTPVDSSDKSSEGQEILSPSDSSFTKEQKDAYTFAKENGITTKDTIQSAQMNGKLTRIAMAKMLSQYAINVLGQTPDTSKTIKFKDVTSKKDADYDNGVTLAYQLGIMGQNMPGNNFRPNDEVTRAEFVTALSRLLYKTTDGEYKSTSKYYIHHMEKLVNEGIITKDDPKMKELRGYVMIMLMRSAK